MARAEMVRRCPDPGRVNLASRFPSLERCPEELFDLLDDDAPAWFTRAEDEEREPWYNRSDLLVLQLSANDMKSVDERVGEFVGLTRLELHSNQLTALPSALAGLQSLTALTLSHNQLAAFPACLLGLASLTSLDLSHNQIEALWTEKEAQDVEAPLRSLRTLDLSRNKLRTGALVRAGESEVQVLAFPPKLRRLDLSENALQGPLPLQLFSPLTVLEELDLNGNDIPDAVFAPPPPDAKVPPALPRLHVLDVRRTHIAALGPLESLFASGSALSLDEARDAQRAPAHAPPDASGLAAHQLVRVSNRPGALEAELASIPVVVGEEATTLPPLFVVLDAHLVRAEPSRRKRGGRGRGGDSRRDDHDETPQGDAGSALANAKLSSKKKEALGQVPCKFFRNNGCSAGDACPFAHTLPGEGQAKAVCQWYLKGSCRFGHRCALAHILPGQPMSMDRKNKRAAQHGQKAEEKPATEKRSASGSRVRGTPLAPPAPGAVFIPESARQQHEPSPPQASLPDEKGGWEDRAAVDAAHAFGTSPFSYPGSHSLFFNTNSDVDVSARALGTTPSQAPWTRAPRDDPLADSSHAEDFLPSSLSDLLTPAELERRTRSTREPHGPRSTSQSLPTHGPDFGALHDISPPAPMGHYSVPGRVGAQGTPMPGRMGAQSVHASPFLAALSSPPSAGSPMVGDRVALSFGARPMEDGRRMGMGHPFRERQPHAPISPALLPARDDTDDAIFELE